MALEDNRNLTLEPLDLNVGASKVRTFIFIPSDDKDMMAEYPELSEIPEFQVLTNSELKFVWFLANPTSPFRLDREPEEGKRMGLIRKCLEFSKLQLKISEHDKNSYVKGFFGQKIKDAIDRMKNFSPSIRMKAKIMNQKMFNNMEKMVDVSKEELEEMTPSDKKEYLSVCKLVQENLSDLIPALESSFGVKEIKTKQVGKVSGQPTWMDLVMKSE